LAELEENKLNKQQGNPNNVLKRGGGLIDISQKQKTDKSAITTSTEPERPIEHFFNKLRAVFAENVFFYFFIFYIFFINFKGYCQGTSGRSTSMAP